MKHPELRPAILERLKRTTDRASTAGLVIGIETALDVAGEVKLIDEIDSPVIRKSTSRR